MATTQYDLNKPFVESVRQATDIVQVVGQHVSLRKRGNNYLGLCPFHKEKTPSFTVSPDKHMYYCFGCGANGDIFSFLQEQEGLSFPEAVVELAKAAGLSIPEKTRRSQEQQLQRQHLLNACTDAAEYFSNYLQSEAGKDAREYLLDRGLTEETLQNYHIGFAPDGYENLLNALKDSHSGEILEKAGLAQKSQKSRGYYDRFRKRIMIPIRNTGGDIIAFGGRIFGDGEPKYLNSPETSLFHKSKVLFGLYEGHRNLRKQGFAILVEGYFDAIVLHQHGFVNTIAPLGTSFGEQHAHILGRYCKKAVLAMDGDEAGRTAAVKTAAILVKAGFAVNIVNLPDGEDPDSYITENGRDAFKELLQRSSSVTRFALRQCRGSHDVSRPGGKRDALDDLLPLLSAFSDPLQRSEAVTLVSQDLQIPEHTIIAALRSVPKGPETQQPDRPKMDMIPRYERELLKSSVKKASISKKAVDQFDIIDYVSTFTRSLLSVIWQESQEGKEPDVRKLIDTADNDAEKQFITEIVVGSTDDDFINPEECARGIAIDHLKRRIQAINERIASLDVHGDQKDSLDSLYAEKLSVTAEILALEGDAQD